MPSTILHQQSLDSVLKRASRAFYLSLWILPTGLKEPIGLAYLLARVADTIADTRIYPQKTRMRFLINFREQLFHGQDPDVLKDMTVKLLRIQSLKSEKRLLESLPAMFTFLEKLPTYQARSVRDIVAKLTLGIEFDIVNFPDKEPQDLRALQTQEDLDRYTYMVAGCVGEFWTQLSIHQTDALKNWDQKKMSALGVEFGKALQMTNILRDIPGDLKIGRCYLPQTKLEALNLSPQDLKIPENSGRARPVLVDEIRRTLRHYECAEVYLFAIPKRCVRLRLASAWALLIGLGTLVTLARNIRWLDGHHPSKVTRAEVYRILILSIFGILSNHYLRIWIKRRKSRIESAL